MNSYEQTNSSKKSLEDSQISLIDRETIFGVKKESRKFLIIGYNRVGKTSLATKFLLDFFPENEMKLEDDLCKIVSFRRKKVEIKVVDAQSEYNESNYFFHEEMKQDVDGCIYVYSVDDKMSFQIIKTLRKQVYEINGKDLPAILIANKSDLKNKNVVSSEEGWKLSSDLDEMPFFEISCKDDNIARIEDVFLNLYEKINQEENSTEIKCC